METIENLTDIEEIYQSNNSIVLSGTDLATGKKVAVKILNSPFPSSSSIARFNEEAELTQRFNIVGVRKVLQKKKINNRHALVMEYIEGSSFEEIINANTLDTPHFLHLAVQACTILAEIHKFGIIHKDINPRNLLWGADAQVYIIDLGIATVAKKETQKIEAPEKLEGTLAYIAPEQTGRMNHSIDSRSDLYSLGITFYQMITGSLPFETTNSIELVHSHIAKIPETPQEKIPTVPAILSKIVMKLINKNIDERYQTALGLRQDLQKCVAIFEQGGLEKLQQADFELGTEDFNANFHIPEKLYGRAQERQKLLQAFQNTEEGGYGFLLVTGKSGVGKTKLVGELYRPVTEKRSYFLAGKFEQFQRDVPYSAVITAINGFVQQLLGESDKRLAHWKREIMEALGENAGVLTQLIPSLELIICKQAEPMPLPPVETQNRFNHVFQRFFKDLSIPKHTLVLFIDDWQWADTSSLNLLSQLVQTPHLLIIAAYRDNEVTASHPFMLCLEDIKKTNTPLDFIELQELELPHITTLLQDTFQTESTEIDALAQLIKTKTSGNAFFVSQFLQNLYEGGHIAYSYNLQKWLWDNAKIAQLPISHNVLDLMTARIKSLPEETQELLQLASCVGTTFGLKLLSELYGKNQIDTRSSLLEALEQGFILPYQNTHYAVDESDIDFEVYFKFLHDRVQYACYYLADEDYKEAVNLKIGRMMYESQEDNPCDVANYYNKGRKLIQSEEEKLRLATLDLKAAAKAQKVTAHSSALEYAKCGLEVLGEESWANHFQLCFQLHKYLADSLFLSGNKEEAEQIFQILIEKSQTRLQKIKVYNMIMLLYESSGKYVEAVKIARLSLALMHIVLPTEDSEKVAVFQAELQKMDALLEQIGGVENLRTLPAMQDEEMIEAVEIMYIGWTSCYMAGDMNLVLLLACQMVNISIKHGNTPETVWAYIAHANFVASGTGNYALGYALGKISTELNDLNQDIKTKGAINHLMGIFLYHWRKPIRAGLPYFKTAFEASLSSGNFGYAGYAHCVSARHQVLAGLPLPTIEAEVDKYMAVQLSIKNNVIAQLGIVVNAYVKNLLGKSKSLYSFDNDEFEEAYYLNTFESLPIFLAIYAPLKARLHIYHAQYAESLAYTGQARDVMMSVFGSEWNWFQNSNHSLALCGILREENPENAPELIEQVEKNQAQMKIWAKNCPENFLHQYLTIEAELANIRGEVGKAMDLYDEAIQQAQMQEFVQDEALACELTALFYLKRKKIDIAKIYLQKAIYNYKIWGAETKIQQMREAYKDILALTSTISQAFETTTSLGQTLMQNTILGGSYGTNMLDLGSVMKASLAISEEIKLESLLRKMTSVLMENAGAERATLIQERDGQLFIIAEANIHVPTIYVAKDHLLTNQDKLPLSIIRSAYRTQESIVSNNIQKDTRFSSDAYLQQHKIKSVLCMPVVHQSKVQTVLYMEHSQVEGAFTHQRVELLNMLSSQMAVSIENALLYDTMEQKVEARTTDLAQANAELTHINHSLTASIKYAQRMQEAILPKMDELATIAEEFFLIYLPKDIVSGDFYWHTVLDNKHVVAVVDCTGHGVPGAFMSMIGNTLLNEIVGKKQITEPAKILEKLHTGVRYSLNQEKNSNYDGMDMSLCTLEKTENQIQIVYAGAKNALYYVQAGKLGILEPDRRSIGGETNKVPFTNKSLTLQTGDSLYLTTDGFIDQAGGNLRSSFTRSRLLHLIQTHHADKMENQKNTFLQALQAHQGNTLQRDDITVIGFRL